MQNEQRAEAAEVWRAAQHRRTEDLAKGLSYFLKQSEMVPGADIAYPSLKPRVAFAHGMAIAIATLVSITSVSAVVHASKSTHVSLRATGPMPAVNIP
jgi:hypothetical protein